MQKIVLALSLLVLALSGVAQAINSPDQEIIVEKLTAAEILEITTNKTWIIDFDGTSFTSTTYFKDGGERFSWRNGQVDRLEWFVDNDADRRCVKTDSGSLCGHIVRFGETVKICMRLDPLGDCSYTVVRIEEGDYYGLEERADEQRL